MKCNLLLISNKLRALGTSLLKIEAKHLSRPARKAMVVATHVQSMAESGVSMGNSGGCQYFKGPRTKSSGLAGVRRGTIKRVHRASMVLGPQIRGVRAHRSGRNNL